RPDPLTVTRQHVADAARLLGEGKYHRAADEFAAARVILQARPDLLPAAEARDLGRLERQAMLLADLLTESLGEIFARAARLDEGGAKRAGGGAPGRQLGQLARR